MHRHTYIDTFLIWRDMYGMWLNAVHGVRANIVNWTSTNFYFPTEMTIGRWCLAHHNSRSNWILYQTKRERHLGKIS